MDKRIFWLLIVIIAVGLVIAGTYLVPKTPITPVAQAPTSTVAVPGSLAPLDATYTISGLPIKLSAGAAETQAAPGSATMVKTTVFGEPVIGDLNGDGMSDAAVFLVQDTGGSGTFYYVAAAIAGPNGTQGTNAVLLGDRIAPQTLEIRNGEIIANYADRKPGEPMTAQPSVGVSKYLTINGITLEPAPTAVGPGERCGGNMLNAPVCESGYHCAPEPGSHLPFGDVGGICVKN